MSVQPRANSRAMSVRNLELLICSLGQQILPHTRACHHPHHCNSGSSRLYQHWLCYSLQWANFAPTDRSLYLIPSANHLAGPSSVWYQRDTLGSVDNGEMGASGQPVCYGILWFVDYIYGVSPVPACKSGEHQLRRRHFRRCNALERHPMVRLWEEVLFWTGKGGYRGSPSQIAEARLGYVLRTHVVDALSLKQTSQKYRRWMGKLGRILHYA